mgnify:CR=1 FL=1
MPNGTQDSPKPIAKAAEAVDRAKEQLGQVAGATEAKVKEFPLAAVGLAFGAGVLLGAVGYALLHREPPTLRERLEERLDDAQAGKKLQKLLDRVI